MKFEGDLAHIESIILKHDELDNALELQYVQRLLDKKNINKDVANKIINGYELTFLNHTVETARFIRFVMNSYLFIDEFSGYLYIYMKQCYSKLELMKHIKESSDLIVLFNKYYARLNDIMEDIYIYILAQRRYQDIVKN